ncbi:MAG: alpha/beta hydrolase, partial [Rhodocyclaceae bacterium]|nr:alpha/beta hydrolase [Rhodocyclaceae bacterium]
MKTSTSEFLTIRGLRHHVRIWGPPHAPKVFLLHGWMDVSASFQFLVDAFSREWRI